MANSLLHWLGLSTQGFLTDPGQALLVLVGSTLRGGVPDHEISGGYG